jgi:hypothetical protein
VTGAWNALKDFGLFWWDFLVGDDWTAAAGVLLALGATYGLHRAGAVPAWWLLPLAVVAVVALTVRRANARERRS